MFYIGRSELRILIDPVTLHVDGSNEMISNQVSLTTMLHYLPSIGENKVKVKILFPEYLWHSTWRERYLALMPGDYVFEEGPNSSNVEIIKSKPVVKAEWKQKKIKALRDYLEKQKEESLRIKKFDTSEPEEIKRLMESINDGTLLNYRDADYLYNNNLIDIVDQYFDNNCDLLLTSNRVLLKHSKELRKLSMFPVNYPEVFNEVETFLKGHHIYINHINPVYGLDPSTYSPMTDPRWFRYHRLWEDMDKIKHDNNLNEYFRALLFHRYSFLMYSIDQIKFQIFQADRMDEQKLRLNHYFLASYHLNSVYINIWAFLDNLAWILNYLLNLGFDKKSAMKVTFTSKDYKKKFVDISPDIYKLIFTQENIDWFDQLSIKRHPAAHREPLFFANLVNQKDMSQISERMVVVGTKDGRAFFDAISNMEVDADKLFKIFDSVCDFFSIEK